MDFSINGTRSGFENSRIFAREETEARLEALEPGTEEHLHDALVKRAESFSLPEDVLGSVFRSFSFYELDRASAVNRTWNKVVNEIADSKIRNYVFGKRKWEKYVGDLEAEPSLPSKIFEILQSPCPFWPGKRVLDTHLLVLVSKTVNEQPLTLRVVGELVQKPKEGHATKY